MFEFITDEEQRGQVGIGTLIVFIAMVLVAAIAAGVLINTAGLLQTQAEDTGQDSTDQVANNINVIGSVGSVANTSGTDVKIINNSNNVSDFDTELSTEKVHTLRLTVQKSPGAADIDLSGLSIQYVGPDSFANLVHHTKADEPAMSSGTKTPYITESGDAAYYIQTVTAESQDTVMTEESDRYEIIVPLQQAYNSSGPYGEDFNGVDSITGYDNTDLKLLNNGANVELTMTTDSGSQRYVNLRVPDSLVGDGGGTVQL